MRSVSLCLLLIVSLVIFGCAAKNTATVPETDNAPVAQTVTLEVDNKPDSSSYTESLADSLVVFGPKRTVSYTHLTLPTILRV